MENNILLHPHPSPFPNGEGAGNPKPSPSGRGLGEGADIWLLDFTSLTENQISKFPNSLSSDELTRAQTFKHNQHHFLATRALVRNVLAYYTNLPSSSLEFARKEHGKPFLSNTPYPIYFNLSHSGNYAALAVTTLGEIGIDIESIRARNLLAIAERYFHANELQQLLVTPEAEREPLFFKLWTLKEAFFKATGGGISSGLDKAVFDLSETHIQARFAAELNVKEHEWRFQQVFISPTTLCALALHTHQPFQPRWFDGNRILTS